MELVAGTGVSSEVLFEALKDYKAHIRYIYTDFSDSFFLSAKEKFADVAPYLETEVFDIEGTPETQNITIGSCDIIIGANVVHTTKNITKSLNNIKTLLKKDGVLVLHEIAQTEIFSSITFGLLDNWWLYEDEELRLKGGPGLSATSWQEVLNVSGYLNTAIYPETEVLSQQIIMAQSNGLRLEEKGSSEVLEETSKKHMSFPKNKQNTVQLELDFLLSKVMEITSDTIKIPQEEFDINEQFSDFGFDSILGGQLIRNINATLGISLNPTDIFNYPNIKSITDYISSNFSEALILPDFSDELQTENDSYSTKETLNQTPLNPIKEISQQEKEVKEKGMNIAIVGMSGQYGGANDLEEFWEILKEGKSLIKEVPTNRWSIDKHYHNDRKREGKTYCKWGSFLEGIDEFDSMFFRISGREAKNMDPQQRLFLQHCWKSFEDAGITPEQLNGLKCGVYVGTAKGDYIEQENPKEATEFWGNNSSILAARISYYLNLVGPAIAIDTACSSSLVALDLACKSLANGEVEVALSGGVTLNTTPKFYKLASKAGMLSEDGQCYTFDHRANGFVPGEGVGVLVLKRLEDAEKAGDPIYGVIKGIATNQDGTTNGITAPSVKSQEQLEKEIYEKYQIHPETISYVEAHGTGTKLGDPIEFQALTSAFRKKTDKTQFCGLGSVKTNIGHALTAAGVAGVQKVLLSMKHQLLPASINYEKANPLLNIEDSPFYINNKSTTWTTVNNQPRRATVSSFGFSGTNAHLVIEEYNKKKTTYQSKEPALIILSAKNKDRLNNQVTNLKKYLNANQAINFYDMVYTLQVGRAAMEERLAIIANNLEDLISKLQHIEEGKYQGIFIGNSKQKTNLNRPDSRVVVKTDNLTEIAQEWVTGKSIDWELLYDEENKPNKINLPTYPFAKEKHWISNVAKTDLTVNNKLHPLVHRNNSNLEEQRFISYFTGEEAFAADHIVQGNKIFPGVAYLELAREAAALSLGQSITQFQHIKWLNPLKINQPKQIHISIFEEGNDVAYEVYSKQEDQEIIHAQGKVGTTILTPPPSLNIESIKKSISKQKKGKECYDFFETIGLNYGASFQGIKELYYSEEVSLSKLNLSKEEAYVLQLGILDSALQTCVGMTFDKEVDGLSLPFNVKEMNIYGDVSQTTWCYARKNKKLNNIYDIDLLSETGEVLLSFKEFAIVPVSYTHLTLPTKA